ncbi:Aromatic amino acid aminotransferase [Cyphellophora attinorum]|uniref:Aromatic amino acid aminotransferase n=1 Tax=Cyphellophora attinorum TaxID=1664694 RepID=A0A0N1HAJ8_9EURO|nr:Aromatic amino acid aminotransferase [Phialophora attinorum]KPI45022.1 Aromatic amino acid aminotransferase [Phialophora attinorum]
MSGLTIDGVDALRASSVPIASQVAGSVSSESFKSTHSKSQNAGKSMHHHFSVESQEFTGSALKKVANKVVPLPFIPLGTGRPSADLYPWEALSIRTTGPHTDTPANSQPRARTASASTSDVADVASESKSCGIANATAASAASHDLADGSGSDQISRGRRHPPDSITRYGGGYDLARGLNYSNAAGSQPLVRFFTEHVEIVHSPPYSNWETVVTCGSTSAMEMLMRMLCNRGETILTERYTYPGTIEVAALLGVKLRGISMDAGGIIPDELESALQSWNVTTDGPRPSVLYTIPSGQNPTGATQTLARKRAIYTLAEKYDLLIIEDDPYYFLRVDTDASPTHDSAADPDDTQRAKTYLAKLTPSYLSIDYSGRVVRLDSTSKILAPGLRAGWITACSDIIAKFSSYTEVSTVSVSGPSQLMLWHLLEETWGHVGFFCWLDWLSRRYKRRLNALVDACERYLPRDLCSWTVPQCGMFLWVAIDLGKHSTFGCPLGTESATDATAMLERKRTQLAEIEGRVYASALRNGTQCTVGSLFDTMPKLDLSLHIRLTYAAADEQQFEKGVQGLADALREEFGDRYM